MLIGGYSQIPALLASDPDIRFVGVVRSVKVNADGVETRTEHELFRGKGMYDIEVMKDLS